MPRSWTKVHNTSSGKYRIRIHDGEQEHDLTAEFDSEEEVDSAITELKGAPTNKEVVRHDVKPRTW
ncbi:MAG: hypothetical protein QOG21_2001 [Actinomycetota bacterium]|jgi:hypothetical protein|nr:hypothetical protein [Actinomycetota bacterium]